MQWCNINPKFESYSYQDFENLLYCLKQQWYEVKHHHSKWDHHIWEVNWKKFTIPYWEYYPRFLIRKIIKSIFTATLKTA
jgi:hypothetical protein